MTSNTTDPVIGRLIDGRYQVRSRIARGGMATVYLATDLRLERLVAVKIMHGHLADDQQFKERFIQEARSSARLAHPNVVNVFDQGQDPDSAYLVMEYLPGITLRELLHDYGSLTPEQTLDIIEAVLSGLAAAHRAGIVHRDLKPENVLLADDGRIKIGDFGLARAASANTATGAALLGTIAYLSPELVTRGIADTRSDIYAVGIMMYEMLTGEQPFKGEQPMQIAYQHANDSVPTPSSKNPRVPAELDELVLWATARDPEHRPRDARAMLEQLHETQRLLETALPTAAIATQKTMLLPAASIDPAADAQTQVIAGRTPQRTGPVVSSNTATLATRAQRRRAKGWWLFGLVLVLAGLAGGTGWYFGAGPGSQVTVTDVRGLAPEEARATLEELGVAVSTETGTEYSEVEPGLVSSTYPAQGATVARGTAVTLVLSQGRQPVTVPPLGGVPLEEARAQLAGVDVAVGDTGDIRFSPDVPRDAVIAASRASDGSDVTGGGDYFAGLAVNLVLSAGPIPDVAGATVDEATQTLAGVELSAVPGEQVYHDTIEAGRVIGVGTAEVVRPGDDVTLTISRGPEPVPVPDVVDMTWTEAKPILEEAGFELVYNLFADMAPSLFTVTRTDPGAGVEAERGTTVRVTFTS